MFNACDIGHLANGSASRGMPFEAYAVLGILTVGSRIVGASGETRWIQQRIS